MGDSLRSHLFACAKVKVAVGFGVIKDDIRNGRSKFFGWLRSDAKLVFVPAGFTPELSRDVFVFDQFKLIESFLKGEDQKIFIGNQTIDDLAVDKGKQRWIAPGEYLPFVHVINKPIFLGEALVEMLVGVEDVIFGHGDIFGLGGFDPG